MHTDKKLKRKKKLEGNSSKGGLKTAGSLEVLRVASGLLSCFPSSVSLCKAASKQAWRKRKSLFCFQNMGT